MHGRRLPSPKALRDAAMFMLGAGLLYHETVLHAGPERPTLILAFLILMGLPVSLRWDEKARDNGTESPKGVGTSGPGNMTDEDLKRLGEEMIRRAVEGDRREWDKRP